MAEDASTFPALIPGAHQYDPPRPAPRSCSRLGEGQSTHPYFHCRLSTHRASPGELVHTCAQTKMHPFLQTPAPIKLIGKRTKFGN